MAKQVEESNFIVPKKPMYTPPAQMRTGLYTTGKEWMYVETFEEYIGPYHTYPNKAVYTLGTFVRDKSKQLMPYTRTIENNTLIDDPSARSENNSTYFKLTGTRFDQYQKPVFFYPNPDERDYSNGNFDRFFAQRINDVSDITEIDKKQFDKINLQNKPGIDKGLYKVHKIKWSIAGSLLDSEIVNKRILLSAERTISGIGVYLSDLNEFHRSEHLVKQEPQVDPKIIRGRKLEDISEYILSGENEDWYKKTQEKSVKNNRTIKEQALLEANWVLDNDPNYQ